MDSKTKQSKIKKEVVKILGKDKCLCAICPLKDGCAQGKDKLEEEEKKKKSPP